MENEDIIMFEKKNNKELKKGFSIHIQNSPIKSKYIDYVLYYYYNCTLSIGRTNIKEQNPEHIHLN